ncbi:MAG TPA: sporulation integral membrane protein YtvI [Syntrophomonas sp.]|nr:sporulation integral membrane protein YtvI [Syntrophomonas sp.]HCF70037.1 sporulation integral membrane protein YtvI [Syntrophomonas sp.]
MMDPELQKNIKTLIRLTIFVMALVAIHLLFTYVFPIVGNMFSFIPVLFMPIIMAVILAVLIEPVVNFFETRLRLKRSLAVLMSLLVVVGGFFYLLFEIVSIVIKEMSGMYMQAASHSDEIINKIMTSFTDIKIFYLNLSLPPQVEPSVQSSLQKAVEWLQSFMDQSINSMVQIIGFLPNFFIFLIIATVATFFIIRDRAELRKFILDILPGHARSKTREIIGQLFKALVGFLKAYMILISITAIITMTALKILQIKYVLTLGLLIGLMDILPILGPGGIFVPWIIWEFISGDTRMGISLLVVYIIISAVRQFLEPQIVGENIGLHPLATLISLYAGLQLGGVAGMILGPILVVIFIACYRAGLFERFSWGRRHL